MRAIPLARWDRDEPPEGFPAPCCGHWIAPRSLDLLRFGWVTWDLCPHMQECVDLAAWAEDIERAERDRHAALAEQAAAEERRRKARQAWLDTLFPWGPRAQRNTWATYHPRTARQAAIRDTLRAYAEAWDGPERGWYLMGPVGTGKSHLAHAVGNTLRAQGIPVLVASVPLWLDRLRAAYEAHDDQEDRGDRLMREMATLPLVILDDLGAERPTEWALERLYLVIDQRYQACLPVGITTNWRPGDLADVLGSRIVSRLVEMCDLYTLDGGDYRVAQAREGPAWNS